MVYIILGKGFEEIEALAPCDLLRRGGVEVKLAGIGGYEIPGGRGIRVTADCLIEDIDLDKADMIVVPGGMVGVETIESTPAALEIVKKAYDMGIYVAAICAGPRVLAGLGILDGKNAVCYPGMEDQMTGGKMSQDNPVVIDGKVITGRAAGAAIDFGLAILEVLRDGETAKKVGGGIYYPSQK
jgi:4-methyl-5(b-hydroxyethyl)-thiazole monophosphate biosynthesis